jgi:hypothetical protein
MPIATQEVKERYDSYQKKYDLPSFEAFDKEFELIDYIQRLDFIPHQFLAFVRRMMVDKFFGWVNYLHTFVQPSTHSAVSMHEHAQMSDEQREQITQMVQKLMFYNRSSIAYDLEDDEVKDGTFIKESFELWAQVKPKLKTVVAWNVQAWKEEKEGMTKKKERVSGSM